MPIFADLDRLRADLDALRPLAPEQEARVLQKFRLEWNYNSNAIEGNSLTLGETRSLLLHGLTAAGKPMRDHLDIKGHNEAVVALEEFVRSEYPLTEQFIREMHQLLLGESYHTPAQTAGGQPTRKLIVPGRYKTSPNNVLTATGEMFYFASPEETPGRMTDLVDWYRAEEAAPTMHPVALAAEFHYRFVRIHPFDDGNGRMSRLLMNLILLRHGYPMTVIKADDRNRYLAALSAADAGEPEPFLRFIIENVEASLRLMIRAARGESIDETSDLDKKLALLKKQLDAPAPNPNHLLDWNDSMQIIFIDAILNPWINDLSVYLNKFDSFFKRKKLFVQGFTKHQGVYGRSISTVGNTADIITSFLGRESKIGILLGGIQFTTQWSVLKNDLEFEVNLIVDFLFETDKFIIRARVENLKNDYISSFYESSNTVFQGKYQEMPSEQIVAGINYQLANKVYDFIAAKVAEADTPPA
jgi:Fic family protein